MKRLSSEELHARSVSALGLDAEALELTSTEALSCLLRRAASFLCPCPPRALVCAVEQSLTGLAEEGADLAETVEDALDALVAHGDLFELSESGGERDSVAPAKLLYTAPPSFVCRGSGAALILGVAPDRHTPLPQDLAERIEHVNHVRRIEPNRGEDLREDLLRFGLVELSHDAWLKLPDRETASQHLARLRGALAAAPPSGEVPGLTLLDPARPVRYYRGRWVEPRQQTGRFVGRRKQAYGADLWCYVEMKEGRPNRFLDLPLPKSRLRGCDEAWRLQAAIDATAGHPQQFSFERTSRDAHVLKVYSPAPAWAKRRWDSIGEPTASSGCLFAYRFRESEVGEERSFLRERLWLAEAAGNK